MKRKFCRFAEGLLLILLICLVPFAPSRSEEETRSIAVILVADDGFTTLSSENNISIQEVMDIYIAAAEEEGYKILLQGPSFDNSSSALKYSTGQESPDWNLMPAKGDLRFSVNGLTKEGFSVFDKLVVIAGHLGNTKDTAVNKLSAAVPTYLFQTMEFTEGEPALLSRYGSVANLTIPEQSGTDQYGNPVYNAVNEQGTAEIHFSESREEEAYDFLQRLLLGSVFDGSIPVQPAAFSIPASYVDDLFLLLRGDNLEDVKLISPDGARYPVVTNSNGGDNTLVGRVYPLSGTNLEIISLKEILQGGEWKIESSAEITAAELYYTLKGSADTPDSGAAFVDDQMDGQAIDKGVCTFRTLSDAEIRDLFALYPALRLRVTDTVDDAITGEITAPEEHPNKLDIKFGIGGDHQLTFRLMNGDREIRKQTLNISVNDQAPVINPDIGKEFVVYPDALEGNEWKQSVEGWFTDPDGDKIIITKVGDDTDRVSFADNTLTLHLEENILDGSEDVILNAKSDTQEIQETVKISWRSLKAQMNSVRITATLEPAEDGGSFVKRAGVRVRAAVNYEGEDKEKVFEELRDCAAVLKDQEGNIVAEASFDHENGEFVTKDFDLPEHRGDYRWTLCLESKENHLPQWNMDSDKTDKITIGNHAPVTEPDLLAGETFGEQYVFDVNEWGFTIPEGLITDQDNDPVSYTVSVREIGDSGTEPNEYGNPEDIGRIMVPDFGEYNIVIQGKDNDGSTSEEIINKVQLYNLKETLEGITGKISAQPAQESYTKKDKATLTLQLDTKNWSEKKKNVLTEWLAGCDTEVLLDEEVLEGVNAEYNEETVAFAAKVDIPEKGKEYKYKIRLKSKPDEVPEVESDGNAVFPLTVGNAQPVLTQDTGFTDIDAWEMKSEEYHPEIPEGYFTDPDEDNIRYGLKLILKDPKQDQELLNEEDIALPYELSFEPFGFFELTREYAAEITATDDDAEPASETVRIVLHNRQLLYIIIGAAVLLLLIIATIILYAIHRKNLPQFRGKLYFANKDKPVSNEIDLSPWKKQKSVPLSIFTGSITTRLDDEQWERMKELEVRPNKEEGFRLYQIKAKADSPEEMPYDLSNGISVKKRNERV